MIKKLILIFFLSLLISNSTQEKDIFNHSFKNINLSSSIFSFKILKSNNKFTNYNISWSPTSNLYINTNFINEFNNNSGSSDNKLYYGINISLLLFKNMYSGIGINTIKFDNSYNKLKWIDYFFDYKFRINSLFNLNIGLSYLSTVEHSFFKTNFYIHKQIYNNINIGIGSESVISSSSNKIYLAINYSL